MNEKIEKARNLFEQGKAPSEIAEILGVSPGTVRSWKSRGKWSSGATPQRNVAKKRCNTQHADAKLIQSVEANPDLTDQQRAFCLHYVKTFNATMAYKRAYGCSYDAAHAHGYELLQRVAVRAEVARLKKIRSEAILTGADDIVDRYMKIAFTDISDYIEWGRATVPVMGPFGPIKTENPATGEKVIVTREVNDVRFKEDSEVDGTLISEVKLGKDGASIKLPDRLKALQWLADYFELNPTDRHKREYDERRLEIDLLKVKASLKSEGEPDAPDDGFADALNGQATAAWKGGDDNVG